MVIGRIRFLASTIAPKPEEIEYWIDLSEDRYGCIIKCYNGVEWERIDQRTYDEIISFKHKLDELLIEIQECENDLLQHKEDFEEYKNETDSSLNTINEQIEDINASLETLLGESASEFIDKYNEILNFLTGYEDTDTLQSILSDLKNEISQNITEIESNLTSHINNKNNPHNITKQQVGLSNVTNDAQVKRSEMGTANGIATLNEQGLIPSNQLPSYVDDVIDCYATYSKEEDGTLSNIKLYLDAEHQNMITGESGKIYVDITGSDSAYQFRWTGTQFTVVGAPTVIGEITGTAFDGARGKALEDKTNQLQSSKQDKLISGTNIKTINGESLLGTGNITIENDGSSSDNMYILLEGLEIKDFGQEQNIPQQYIEFYQSLDTTSKIPYIVYDGKIALAQITNYTDNEYMIAIDINSYTKENTDQLYINQYLYIIIYKQTNKYIINHIAKFITTNYNNTSFGSEVIYFNHRIIGSIDYMFASTPIRAATEFSNSIVVNNIEKNQSRQPYCSAFGDTTYAFGINAFATGTGDENPKDSPLINPNSSIQDIKNVYKNDKKLQLAFGNNSSVFGSNNLAYGVNSSAFGSMNQVYGNNSITFGYGNIVNEENSYILGYNCQTRGVRSIAIGDNCTAYGINSIALGYGAQKAPDNITDDIEIEYQNLWNSDDESFHLAYGNYSTVTGNCNLAKGINSSANGLGNAAKCDNSFVVGKYNDYSKDNYLFLVGNGSDGSSRTNAFEVYEDGSIWGMYINCHTVTATKDITARGFYEVSDMRLKDNIHNITIDKQIDLVQFNWKNTGKKSYGVIAQQIEQNYPELVETNEVTGYKTVKYDSVLILKCAQLENRIKQLEKQLEDLKNG